MKKISWIIGFGFLTGVLSAQEAMLVKLPSKYGDFLMKKMGEGEDAAVKKIVAKLPSLISSKKIESLAAMSLGDGADTEGASYLAVPEAEGARRFKAVDIGEEKLTYLITSKGELSKEWSPTFTFQQADATIILMERDPEGEEGRTLLPVQRIFSYDYGAPSEIIFYSASELDGQTLNFQQLHPKNEAERPAEKLTLELKHQASGNGTVRFIEVAKDAEGATKYYEIQTLIEGGNEAKGDLRIRDIEASTGQYTPSEKQGTWKIFAIDL